jgi:hypothetical protein
LTHTGYLESKSKNRWPNKGLKFKPSKGPFCREEGWQGGRCDRGSEGRKIRYPPLPWVGVSSL